MFGQSLMDGAPFPGGRVVSQALAEICNRFIQGLGGDRTPRGPRREKEGSPFFAW